MLKLSGRIGAEGLSELKQALTREIDAESVSLDLQEVRLMGQDAVKFLVECESHGMRLLNCPAYVRNWISRERSLDTRW